MKNESDFLTKWGMPMKCGSNSYLAENDLCSVSLIKGDLSYQVKFK